MKKQVIRWAELKGPDNPHGVGNTRKQKQKIYALET